MTKLIVIPEGKICDYIDGKFRNDTPEEYVRQNIEKRLVNEHKYPKEQIAVEFTVNIGSRKPRADIVIFSAKAPSRTQEHIQTIIECKRENVLPTAKKDGVGQLQSYMSACPNCEWGMWTNGKHKEVFRKTVNENGKIKFVDFNDIPSADGRLEDIDRPKRNTLKNAVEDNLLFVFKTCHNHIYVTDGMQKQPAFFELLKVIFCKIEDERNLGKPLEFYASSGERSSPDGQLTVKKRIASIFDQVKRKHSRIFDQNDEIKLKPRSLAYIVSELQKYSLLNTHIDIKGKAYEELVGANLRGDRGEFFTPRNIMHMTVEMLSPSSEDKVLDPSCGTGGFLVTAMNKVIQEMESSLVDEWERPMSKWTDDEKRLFQQRIAEIASTNFFGFDLNPDLVKATKMNMVMNNDGSGNIFQTDSLLPPHAWDADFRKNLARALDVKESALRSCDKVNFYDVIVTNPPFGSKIPIKDSHILEQYELGHIWERDKNNRDRWKLTKRLQKSVPPEHLFIERCLQLLKPGGRMGIVLPDSILGAPGLGYIREWLIRKTRILASIDLHADTFQPRNGTQTSVLFLQKKDEKQVVEEEKTGNMADYPIFMATVERVGHDKRGNPLFKRDKHGNEILVPDVEIIELDQIADGTRTSRIESKRKVIDDQTELVPNVFHQWRKQEGLSW
ncbi:N-6 DNA methylase [Desulfonatronovibrio hydrogenovorans]|uniref:N-6 DNA methylase n=1 Tax=Desulfonatronovibrio hydrogenovorans TaxID=53245 RepID=UPI00048B4D61|nr:N-6 DNA methylase [Desulfonatronovibrio hydrogenovorans]